MDTTGTYLRFTRNLPPAHYLMKLESYSLLSDTKENFDSSSFEVGGYKWKLSFYPNGDKRSNTKNNYISLYLTICNTDILPIGWEVNANFTLFIYNHTYDNYLTFQVVKRFHEMKKEWGFDQMVLLNTFKNVSNGYLFNDTCAFGVEVFVINHTLNSESLSVFGRKGIKNPIFHWEIKGFSKIKMDDSYYVSEVFNSGGTNWKLIIYPKGCQSRDGKTFSMFLKLSADSNNPDNSTIYAKYCLRVIDQINSKHYEVSELDEWFNSFQGYGSEFMSLEDLHKSSNGYILKDTLIVEVEFFVMSRSKFSVKSMEN
ncbi:MATH domain and coiled-coil domain-containing protein At3g58400-like [Cannabis sativa]|uniref:MATH domain and coiled-coil domain-containing protein At3g58400-like n=1 Tax=Cannabis sativa TaxID=3483 RepID=UPI0029CA35AA|nr:MATH domain and coiled-coil domain-containing protein At3g58400-like [Cannabis sativa]